MRFLLCLLIIALLLPASFSFAETQEYGFAKAYISSLITRKQIEERATHDLREAGADQMKKDIALMKNANRAKLELQAAINSLSQYTETKNKTLADAATFLIRGYGDLIKNYNEMVKTLEIMNNPTNATNPNIDLGKMMNEVSQITASQEYISETLFQVTALAVAVLIDQKPDREGHLSYLSIASAERKDLINDLDIAFGVDIKDGPKSGQNYTLASAALMRKLLAGDHKSSDERK